MWGFDFSDLSMFSSSKSLKKSIRLFKTPMHQDFVRINKNLDAFFIKRADKLWIGALICIDTPDMYGAF